MIFKTLIFIITSPISLFLFVIDMIRTLTIDENSVDKSYYLTFLDKIYQLGGKDV